jgi:hypothetical protein
VSSVAAVSRGRTHVPAAGAVGALGASVRGKTASASLYPQRTTVAAPLARSPQCVYTARPAHTQEVPAWPPASAPAARRPPPPPPERASPARRPSAPESSDRRPWDRSPSPCRPSARWPSDEDRQRGHPQTACRGGRDRLAQSAGARSRRPALARNPANVNAGLVPPLPHACAGLGALDPRSETQRPEHASPLRFARRAEVRRLGADQAQRGVGAPTHDRR